MTTTHQNPSELHCMFLAGVLNEIHHLWCDDGPHETHDDTADPEGAVTYLALAIWELMELAEQQPYGVHAAALKVLAYLVTEQYADMAELAHDIGREGDATA
jgi:hypothetical protein